MKDNHSLINISTEEKASADIIESFKTRYERETVGMIKFLKRITKK